MTRFWILAGILGVFCWSSLAFGQDSRLTYRLSPKINLEIPDAGGGRSRLMTRPPKTFTERPPLIASKPLFGRAMAGRLAILDKSALDAPEYDVLWLDINGNGKFEPNEKFFLKPGTNGYTGKSVLAAVEFPAEGGPTVQHFQVTVSARTEGEAYLSYCSASYYVGKVLFGEKWHQVALIDHNGNGKFNDAYEKDEPGDRLIIDFNPAAPDMPRSAGEQVAYLGKYVLVDGVYWSVEAAPDGSRIRVARPDVVRGSLDVEEAVVSITLAGEPGRFTVKRDKAGEPLLLPVGSYTVQQVTLTRTDKSGTRWSLESSGAGPKVEVAAGKGAALKLGAPLTVKANDRVGQGSVNFDLAITGVDGMSYSMQAGGGRPAPPGLVIKDKDGKWQKRYAFAFG